MPALGVLEIALKNAVHRRLSMTYQRDDWWEHWIGDPMFTWQRREVEGAALKLHRRMEADIPDKLVAELTFGFWTSLFNVQFQEVLWKELRLVFPRCPKQQRKRHTVSASLNQIRHLRNRVFHHEQLLWLAPSLSDLHARAIEVIGWLDPQLPQWLAPIDRLPATWAVVHPV